MSTPQAIAFFNKLRVAFMERVSAPNVPPHALKLAYLIAYRYMNRKTWTAYPPQERLAHDLNVSVRTVQRLLDILEPLGLTIMPGDGRGLASRYSIDPERVTRVSPFSAQKGDKKGRQKTPKRVTPVSPQPIENQILEGECLRTPPSRERETNANAFDNSSGGGTPPLDAGPPRQEAADEEKQESSSPMAAYPLRPQSPIERSRSVEREEQFRDLRAVWTRGWASDDAPKAVASTQQAFVEACREADADTIIEAARAHVAAADAPRFLPPLAKWLAARGWKKPPPTKPKGGNGHKGHRNNGYAKPDMFKICLEAGGYREDADGNMYWPGDDPNSGAGDDDEPISTSMWGGGK
jgi:hypothetical protein